MKRIGRKLASWLMVLTLLVSMAPGLIVPTYAEPDATDPPAQEEPNGDEESPDNDEEDTKNGEESPDNDEEDTKNGEEFPDNDEEDTKNGEEDPDNDEEDTKNGEESPDNGEEDPNNGEEDPNNGEEDPNNGEEDPNNGEETPNGGEEEGPGDENDDENDGSNDGTDGEGSDEVGETDAGNGEPVEDEETQDGLKEDDEKKDDEENKEDQEPPKRRLMMTPQLLGNPEPETVATPTFSPEEGTYDVAQTVTISCETEGATIYYTADGTDPTTSSSPYNAAIGVSATTTIKAIAVKESMTNSGIATATYTIHLPVTHTHDGVTFIAWEHNDSLPTSAGSYYLTADVQIGSTWNVPSSTTNLCLNGYGIRMTGSGSVVNVGSGATLNLYDSNTAATHKYSVDGNHLATVDDGLADGCSTFTGGYITGGRMNTSGSAGGGVNINAGGTLNMHGGTIIGNSADKGGGVYIARGTKGTFNLYDGTIRNNNALANNSDERNGGGVYVDGTFVMNGGTITENWCANAGGGILVQNSTVANFTMNSGTIAQNYKRGIVSNIISGDIEIGPDAVIENNEGADIWLLTTGKIKLTGRRTNTTPIVVKMSTNGTFTGDWSTYMGTADPAGYFTSDNADYGVLLSGGEAAIGVVPHVHDEISFTAWNSTNSLPTAAGSYYLKNDVSISSTWSVPNGTTNLCLNGHGIKMTGSGSAISVGSGATLNLYDCDTTTEHKFTVSAPASNGAGLATVNDALTGTYQTFTGGYITGGNAENGGGIHVQNGGYLTLNGGTIIGNQSSNMGAGIKISHNAGDDATSRVTMTGGAIMYNKVAGSNTGWGGGVNSDGGFTLNGGTVSHNYASQQPGGIHCHYLYLNGGSIENNYAAGTAVTAGAHADKQVSLSGAPVVSGNITNGVGASNLDCDRNDTTKNTKLSITGALASTASIGVTLRVGGTGVFAVAGTDYTITDSDASKFTSDAGYTVVKNGSGQLELQNLAASVSVGTTTTNYETFAGAVTAWNAAETGATLKLLKDVTTTSTISVSGTKTLDLNGHGINANRGNFSVITVPAAATLTINDNRPDTPHKFTVADAASNGAGLATVNDALTGTEGTNYQTFTGGYITGGRGNAGGSNTVNGGGLNIEGTVTMYGGTIIGNGVLGTTHGGGFRTLGSGCFVMHNGVIRNNAGLCGGACRLSYGSAEFYGVKIINNRVQTEGGALQDAGYVPLVLQDCEITGNYSQNGHGGGIWLYGTQMRVSGKTVVKDNYVNTTLNNIEIATRDHAFCVGALDPDASIGVTMQTPGVFTNSTDTACNDASKFTSDNASYVVAQNDAGQLYLAEPAKADTPNLTATQPTAAGGTGSIPTTAAHQKSTDGTTWTDCDGAWTNLAPGVYYVRVKATDTARASDAQVIVITKFLEAETSGASIGVTTESVVETVQYVVNGKTVVSTLSVAAATPAVTVAGLDQEAAAQSAEAAEGATVTVTMSVESKSESQVPEDEAAKLKAQASDVSTLDFLDVKVMKAVTKGSDTTSTTLETTSGVLEIIVPYHLSGRTDVAVYRYHKNGDQAGEAERFTKIGTSDTPVDGTYRLDTNNSLIYLYTRNFSTYAIGYTQCYNVSGTITFGGYSGPVTVSLQNKSTGETMTDSSLEYSFTHVPKGTYDLTVSWEEKGKTKTVTQRDIQVGT